MSNDYPWRLCLFSIPIYMGKLCLFRYQFGVWSWHVCVLMGESLWQPSKASTTPYFISTHKYGGVELWGLLKPFLVVASCYDANPNSNLNDDNYNPITIGFSLQSSSNTSNIDLCLLWSLARPLIPSF